MMVPSIPSTSKNSISNGEYWTPIREERLRAATSKRKERGEEQFQENKKKVAKTRDSSNTQPHKENDIFSSKNEAGPTEKFLVENGQHRSPTMATASHKPPADTSASEEEKPVAISTPKETAAVLLEDQRHFTSSSSNIRTINDWIPKEEELLRAAWTSQTRYFPVAEIQRSFLPNRSIKAIKGKARCMNLQRGMAKSNFHWTTEEKHKLRELWTSKTRYYTVREMKSFFPGRSENAIDKRGRLMKLKRGRRLGTRLPRRGAIKRKEREEPSQGNDVVKTKSNPQTRRPVNKKSKKNASLKNEAGNASPGETTPSQSEHLRPPAMLTASAAKSPSLNGHLQPPLMAATPLQANPLCMASSKDSRPVDGMQKVPVKKVSAPETTGAAQEERSDISSSVCEDRRSGEKTTFNAKAFGLAIFLVVLWLFLKEYVSFDECGAMAVILLAGSWDFLLGIGSKMV